MDSGTVDEGPRFERDGTEQQPGSDGTYHLRERLGVVHHGKGDGLDEDAIVPEPFLQTEKHKSAEEELPREQVSAVGKLVEEKGFPTGGGELVERVFRLECGEQVHDEEQNRDHEQPTAQRESPAQFAVAQPAAVVAEASLRAELHNQHREQQERNQAGEEPVVVAVESGERKVGDVLREVFPEERAAAVEPVER